ncbi:hypothetical protein [Blastomonas sp. AAP53]|uniref:hypothetical protein n=1 Tax=Blastomonas sp. AAP53 TaxID=1248760 RepID=UPI00031310A3|nr:hypothetical protein [Blastomonas sp. AAP53]
MTDARNPADDGASSQDMEQLTGKGGAGESGGGAYPNPHTGKEKRGEKRGFIEGGQSENRYYGPKDAQGNSAKGAGRDDLADDKDHEGM